MRTRPVFFVSGIPLFAYKKKFIDRAQLEALAQPLLKTAYGQYLMDIAEGL